MKKFLFVITLLISSVTAFAAGGEESYKIDHQNIDKIFSSTPDLTDQLMTFNTLEHTDIAPKFDVDFGIDNEDKEMIAGIVALGGLVVTGGLIGGLIPLHRFILGTSGNEAGVFFTYFCTWGGCGLFPLIDGIALLTDESKTKYIGNGKVIMW